MSDEWEKVETPKTLTDRIQRFYTEKNPMRILYEEQFTKEESKTNPFLEGMYNAYTLGNDKKSLAGDCRIMLCRLLEIEPLYVEAVRYLLQDVGIRINKHVANSAMIRPRKEYLELLQKFPKPGFKVFYTTQEYFETRKRTDVLCGSMLTVNFTIPVCLVVPKDTKKIRHKILTIEETIKLYEDTWWRKKELINTETEFKILERKIQKQKRKQHKINEKIFREEQKILAQTEKRAFEERRKKEFEEYNARRRKELELWDALQKPENGHILNVLKGLKII